MRGPAWAQCESASQDKQSHCPWMSLKRTDVQWWTPEKEAKSATCSAMVAMSEINTCQIVPEIHPHLWIKVNSNRFCHQRMKEDENWVVKPGKDATICDTFKINLKKNSHKYCVQRENEHVVCGFLHQITIGNYMEPLYHCGKKQMRQQIYRLYWDKAIEVD